MWTRAELKLRGKAAFLRNFWLCVLVALILSLISSSGNNNSSNNNNNSGSSNQAIEGYLSGDISLNPEDYISIESGSDAVGTVSDALGSLNINIGPLSWVVSNVATAFGVMVAIIAAFGAILFSILVVNPLEVGCKRFFCSNLEQKAHLDEIGYAFRNGWLNTSFVIFIRDLKVVLWTLLLIIPGIIKSYEYRMVPYLLAEDPTMSSRDAFAQSKELMAGNKLDAFVLDLSFIGWHILSAVTAGIVGIFWTNPYVQSTNAALFDRLQHGAYSYGNGAYVDATFREDSNYGPYDSI